MRQCLTNPDGGYYTTTRTDTSTTSGSTAVDPFGAKGDFITSPEISQMFGELVGLWFMTEWLAQGRPKAGVQFIEMGPGRGTLMSDILRTVAQFKAFAGAVEGVWLVEAGEGLRHKQRDVLCGEDTEIQERRDSTGKNVWWEAQSKYAGVMVRWVEDIVLLPKQEADTSGSKLPFIVAHEFFDALPIHAFESVAPKPEEEKEQTQLLDTDGNPMVRQSSASKVPQWRELLVNTTKRKFALPSGDSKPENHREPDPEFHLTLAKASNPSSLVLPERSRYKPMKATPGSRVEISPESSRYIMDFATRIGGSTAKPNQPAGAALVIDYGPLDTIPISSLRGIRKHQVISPFVYAGQADISADVDFTALADAALDASEGIEVHGPVEQGLWLNQLGIKERADRLLRGVKDEKKKKELESGWKRLVEAGPRGMGKAYKVMSIVPENGGKRRPVGFGGGVLG